jgi:SAM-dependent methyltransferase
MTSRDPDAADERRARWDERHAAQDPIESHEPDPTLVETCAALAPGRALDLGSGDGRNAIWLARRGWRVAAVDFSSVALERARRRAEALGVTVDWRQEDLLAWYPEAGAFDLVTLVFIHLPGDERHAVYAKAADAVASGGTLLVIAHDRSNIEHGVGGPQDPDVLVAPAEIVAGLPAGFRVERAETVRRGSDPGPVPIDAVVQARRATVSAG